MMQSEGRVRSFSSLLDASDDFPVSGSGSRSRKRGDGTIALVVLSLLLAAGVALGVVLPASDELHGPYRRISVIIGWTYFCRWTSRVLWTETERKSERAPRFVGADEVALEQSPIYVQLV